MFKMSTGRPFLHCTQPEIIAMNQQSRPVLLAYVDRVAFPTSLRYKVPKWTALYNRVFFAGYCSQTPQYIMLGHFSVAFFSEKILLAWAATTFLSSWAEKNGKKESQRERGTEGLTCFDNYSQKTSFRFQLGRWHIEKDRTKLCKILCMSFRCTLESGFDFFFCRAQHECHYSVLP